MIGIGRSRPDDWPDDVRTPFLTADLLQEHAIAEAAAEVKTLGSPTRVIVATDLLHDVGLSPERTLRAITPEALTRLFAVNAIGPALVAKHLLPLMPRDAPSVFAALSARVGSIGDNRLGGWYGYRALKAALNMLIATLAVQHPRTHPLGVCVALHLGTVDTPLSAPFGQGGRGGS